MIQAVHHGKRNKRETKKFIHKIKERSDGAAPLFLSDGYEDYAYCISETYSVWNEKKQECEVLPDLKYAQVVKHKKNGKLESIEERIIYGTKDEILEIIAMDKRGAQINTSYVESRNGNYRKDDKRLARKTQCHSKKVKYHDAHINFLIGVYNFCSENEAFRECCNEEAIRFETKYTKRSPAMVEGIFDHILSLEELLMLKIPPTSKSS